MTLPHPSLQPHTSLTSLDHPVPHLSTSPSPPQTPLYPISSHLPTPAFDPLFYLTPLLASPLHTSQIALHSPGLSMRLSTLSARLLPFSLPHLTLPRLCLLTSPQTFLGLTSVHTPLPFLMPDSMSLFLSPFPTPSIFSPLFFLCWCLFGVCLFVFRSGTSSSFPQFFRGQPSACCPLWQSFDSPLQLFP